MLQDILWVLKLIDFSGVLAVERVHNDRDYHLLLHCDVVKRHWCAACSSDLPFVLGALDVRQWLATGIPQPLDLQVPLHLRSSNRERRSSEDLQLHRKRRPRTHNLLGLERLGQRGNLNRRLGLEVEGEKVKCDCRSEQIKHASYFCALSPFAQLCSLLQNC